MDQIIFDLKQENAQLQKLCVKQKKELERFMEKDKWRTCVRNLNRQRRMTLERAVRLAKMSDATIRVVGYCVEGSEKLVPVSKYDDYQDGRINVYILLHEVPKENFDMMQYPQAIILNEHTTPRGYFPKLG